jgi:hypothetical protein
VINSMHTGPAWSHAAVPFGQELSAALKQRQLKEATTSPTLNPREDCANEQFPAVALKKVPTAQPPVGAGARVPGMAGGELEEILRKRQAKQQEE